MTTVEEALTRLQIVRNATSDFDGDNPLAGVEAVTAVSGFLVAVLQDSENAQHRMLAANAVVMGGLLHDLHGRPEFRTVYAVFVETVELLIEECSA